MDEMALGPVAPPTRLVAPGVLRSHCHFRSGPQRSGPQLQIVPSMRTDWNPRPSKGRDYIDKLRADNVISGWD